MVVVREGIGREETIMGGVLVSTTLGLHIIPIGEIQISILRMGETRRIISRRL
jgi:hypothetical protein